MKHETLSGFKSSNVAGAKFYAMTHTLVVTFKGGAVYTYHSIRPDTWQAMKDAESKGSFLREHIIPKHKGVKQRE